MLCHFFRVDPDYGMRLARKLGIDVSQHTGGAPAGAAHGKRESVGV